jgi:hypothetical protein
MKQFKNIPAVWYWQAAALGILAALLWAVVWFFWGAMAQHYAGMNNLLIFLFLWVVLIAVNSRRMLKAKGAQLDRRRDEEDVRLALAKSNLQQWPDWQNMSDGDFADEFKKRFGHFPAFSADRVNSANTNR